MYYWITINHCWIIISRSFAIVSRCVSFTPSYFPVRPFNGRNLRINDLKRKAEGGDGLHSLAKC